MTERDLEKKVRGVIAKTLQEYSQKHDFGPEPYRIHLDSHRVYRALKEEGLLKQPEPEETPCSIDLHTETCIELGKLVRNYISDSGKALTLFHDLRDKGFLKNPSDGTGETTPVTINIEGDLIIET
jgi:hypothetical protein